MSLILRTDSDTPVTGGGWHRSSFCAANGCVEVNTDDKAIRVRDSKRADSPVLTFDADEWRAFVAGVKNDEFDM